LRALKKRADDKDIELEQTSNDLSAVQAKLKDVSKKADEQRNQLTLTDQELETRIASIEAHTTDKGSKTTNEISSLKKRIDELGTKADSITSDVDQLRSKQDGQKRVSEEFKVQLQRQEESLESMIHEAKDETKVSLSKLTGELSTLRKRMDEHEGGVTEQFEQV